MSGRRGGIVAAFAALTIAVAVPAASADPVDAKPTTGPESKQLKWWATAALALSGLSAVGILATTANRWVTPPATVTAAPGAAVGWAALWSSLSAVPMAFSGRCDCPRLDRSTVVRFDHAYVYDPQFDYRSLLVASADIKLSERWRARPRLWVALNDNNQRGRVEAMYRWRQYDSGTFLELGGALSHHRFDEGFSASGLELLVSGRVNLKQLTPRLVGTYMQLDLGLGLDYLKTKGQPGDPTSQLLARTVFGIYLPTRAGELELYYDHRRDDYAGGVALRPFHGFLGHLGVAGRYFLSADWGVATELETGSANVIRVGVLRRLGGGS